MNVLVIGSGGREHALAWRLAQSPLVSQVFASPGNPGIAQVAHILPAPPQIADYAHLAQHHGIGLTIVGPEAPLVAGIVDVFRAAKLRIIGPTRDAARLEGSKVFAKEFFRREGIPTARSHQAESREDALTALKHFPIPVVIKADGLAAGKGVIIAHTQAEARDAISRLGPRLVIEEHLEGEEVSFIGVSDGNRVLPFAPAQDHKRIFDGDQGPNTGGMGAYCDARILTPAQTADIMENVMLRTVAGMARQSTPFTGFLFAGLMLTPDGPKILEFNVRLGDPETQAILYGAKGDLLAFLEGDASALTLDAPAVCVVLAAKGYPEEPVKGAEVCGILEAETRGAAVFHAGTATKNGRLVTGGGRVLGVTAGAANLPEAVAKTYSAVEAISFPGMQFRRDIARKGLRRW